MIHDILYSMLLAAITSKNEKRIFVLANMITEQKTVHPWRNSPEHIALLETEQNHVDDLANRYYQQDIFSWT